MCECRICGLQNIKMTQKIHVKYSYKNLVNSRNLPKKISENDKNFSKTISLQIMQCQEHFEECNEHVFFSF
jgi:hypothetical protein